MTSKVDEVRNDPTLTDQERENLDLVLKFRGLPFAERSKYTVPGFKPTRMGMVNLAELKDPGTVGYDGNSIPDREDEILDLIVHGDRVWATWLIHGTHLGELQGMSPTGRTVAVTEIGQWRITDGLICEAWFLVDELALLRQLGKWPASTGGA